MSTSFAIMRLTAVMLLGSTRACSVVTDVRTTFYGAPDNDPPGPATAYNCSGRNYTAGGKGTYANPLTFASAPGEYNACEIVYFPYLKKYLRLEDYCAECTSDYTTGTKHIDVWTGGSATIDTQSQIACEDALTPDANQTVIRNPAKNLVVNSGALWDGSCHMAWTYLNYKTSTYCKSGSDNGTGIGIDGENSTLTSKCQTGCSWFGHCIGCACTTYNDCSDDFVCTGGYCAKA